MIQILVLFFIINACHVGTNLWLQDWVSVAENAPHGVGYYMGVYAAIILIYMILIVWTSYTTMVTVGVRASRALHSRLLDNVLRLPMSFFDTTPYVHCQFLFLTRHDYTL